jgi:MFS family permease
VAIPSIGTDLNIVEVGPLYLCRLCSYRTPKADLQWPLTVFSLAYGCTLLLFGRMGDIFGGRIMFLAGSAWFSIWYVYNHLAVMSKAEEITYLGASGLPWLPTLPR